MTGKIINVHGGPIKISSEPKDPRLEIVKTLEGLLDEAKAGRVRALFMIGLTDENLPIGAWHTGDGSPCALAGAVSIHAQSLVIDLARAVNE